METLDALTSDQGATFTDANYIDTTNSVNAAPSSSLITSSAETLNNGLTSLKDLANSGATLIYNLRNAADSVVARGKDLKQTAQQLASDAQTTAQTAVANSKNLFRAKVAAGAQKVSDAIKQNPMEVVGLCAAGALLIFVILHKGKSE